MPKGNSDAEYVVNQLLAKNLLTEQDIEEFSRSGKEGHKYISKDVINKIALKYNIPKNKVVKEFYKLHGITTKHEVRKTAAGSSQLTVPTEFEEALAGTPVQPTEASERVEEAVSKPKIKEVIYPKKAKEKKAKTAEKVAEEQQEPELPVGPHIITTPPPSPEPIQKTNPITVPVINPLTSPLIALDLTQEEDLPPTQQTIEDLPVTQQVGSPLIYPADDSQIPEVVPIQPVPVNEVENQQQEIVKPAEPVAINLRPKYVPIHVLPLEKFFGSAIHPVFDQKLMAETTERRKKMNDADVIKECLKDSNTILKYDGIFVDKLVYSTGRKDIERENIELNQLYFKSKGITQNSEQHKGSVNVPLGSLLGFRNLLTGGGGPAGGVGPQAVAPSPIILPSLPSPVSTLPPQTPTQSPTQSPLQPAQVPTPLTPLETPTKEKISSQKVKLTEDKTLTKSKNRGEIQFASRSGSNQQRSMQGIKL